MQADLPTRLIQIECLPGSLHPAARLVLSTELDATTVRYATLSHCWGPNGVSVKLLRSNIGAFRSQVHWDILPLTFQEAILAATSLGLGYIWIDALCIVQDCAADWECEASRMVQVYTNCYINISADSSTDGDGGLFRSRDPAMFQAFLVPSGPTHTGISYAPYYCFPKNWDRYIEKAPLKTRSWVTQERFMSPRVVHFCDDQVHWECVELMTSECVDSSFNIAPDTSRTPARSLIDLRMQSNETEKIEKLYELWYLLVESYTEGQLTFISDRPVAIAGLARTFAHLLNLKSTDYLCGLWRPHLALEMMWYTRTSTERAHHSIPSWSWWSVNGNVWFQAPKNVGNYKPVAEVVGTFTTAVSGGPYSTVSSGVLKIRAPICRAKLSRAPDPFPWSGLFKQECNHTIALGQDELEEGKSFELLLDQSSPEFLGEVLSQEVYLLLGQGDVIAASESDTSSERSPSSQSIVPSTRDEITDARPSPKSNVQQRLGFYGVGHYDCLVLIQAGSKGAFRRVGFVSFSGITGMTREVVDHEDEGSECCAILDKHFQSSKVPRHLYDDVDASFMYTITLV
ncbi:uncharacterized protein PG986_008732 [Apiospora aurea]|uniref:Heterokaryon incompatibility domain-containing protein n=1 Tax=Apiospora aurea TaxID=335848 RepID=A0ABR1Q6Y4_9PEZI